MASAICASWKSNPVFEVAQPAAAAIPRTVSGHVATDVRGWCRSGEHRRLSGTVTPA